ncbi:MAG: pantetheine-phosphate adenylyltransferase [Planctomycetota bacterium]|jgi:pantetheine-phosphate adenylyltransferase
MPSLAVYAGSFDPPTTGHTWMIREGAKMFDKLVVSVGVNPDKKCSYSQELRMDWLEQIVAGVKADLVKQAACTIDISVDSFENRFLVEYAHAIGATTILRGIRTETDYTYERTMRHINADLYPEITTVFLMPPRDLCEISSSSVKGMIGPWGWQKVVGRYLPACVFEYVESCKESG